MLTTTGTAADASTALLSRPVPLSVPNVRVMECSEGSVNLAATLSVWQTARDVWIAPITGDSVQSVSTLLFLVLATCAPSLSSSMEPASPAGASPTKPNVPLVQASTTPMTHFSDYVSVARPQPTLSSASFARTMASPPMPLASSVSTWSLQKIVQLALNTTTTQPLTSAATAPSPTSRIPASVRTISSDHSDATSVLRPLLLPSARFVRTTHSFLALPPVHCATRPPTSQSVPSVRDISTTEWSVIPARTLPTHSTVTSVQGSFGRTTPV